MTWNRRAAALFVTVALVAACDADTSSAPPEPVATSMVQAPPPLGVGAEVGRGYPYTLWTHCGIEHARIDGTVWVADPPLGNGANPPREWENPRAEGTLVLQTGDTATFTSAAGQLAYFRRAGPGDPAPEACTE